RITSQTTRRKNMSESNAVLEGINHIKSTVKNLANDAQKDLSKMINNDVAQIKKKFAKEKANLEKMFSSHLNKEISKAKKFLNDQKKELDALQKNIEALVKQQKKPAK